MLDDGGGNEEGNRCLVDDDGERGGGGDASDDAPTALMPLMPLQRTIRDVDEASIRISLAKATGPCGGALMRVTELAA